MPEAWRHIDDLVSKDGCYNVHSRCAPQFTLGANNLYLCGSVRSSDENWFSVSSADPSKLRRTIEALKQKAWDEQKEVKHKEDVAKYTKKAPVVAIERW